jgi:hypothetical protein
MAEANARHTPHPKAVRAAMVLNGSHRHQGFRVNRSIPVCIDKSSNATHIFSTSAITF